MDATAFHFTQKLTVESTFIIKITTSLPISSVNCVHTKMGPRTPRKSLQKLTFQLGTLYPHGINEHLLFH